MEEKRKVGTVTTAAAGGGVVAGAFALFIAWAFTTSTGIPLPVGGEAALTTILGFIGALIGGWLVKPGGGARVDR